MPDNPKNLLSKIGLGEKERKTIVAVFKYSLVSALVVSALAWGIRYTLVQQKTQKRTREALDPTLFYEKKSKDLLPVDIEAHTFSANYYLKNDQPRKAIDHILRIIPLQKNNRGLQLDLSTAYLRAGSYDMALACFKKLADDGVTDSLSCAIEARLGLTLFYLGRLKESVEALDKCIAAHSHSAEALCYRGEVEAGVSGPPEKAQDFFCKAIASDSTYVEPWYQLARVYMNQGQYARARMSLLRVLDIEPLHIRAQSRLGMVYYYLDEPDMAKKSYLTALALNPADYNTHYNLGELYYSKYGDNKNALEEFKKTVAGDSLHREANFKIGLICLANNMTKEAIVYLNRSLSVDAKDIRILLQLGVAYEKLGMRDEAISSYNAILGMDPLNRIALQKSKLLSSS
jgi:tetratricopeptide (TPR) repeat protein